MSNIRQSLLDAGLNVFAFDLVCESLLKNPLAPQIVAKGEPLKIFFPINRGDCKEWAGVEISLMPVEVKK